MDFVAEPNDIRSGANIEMQFAAARYCEIVPLS